jgi:hypothetical protein
MNKKQKFQYGDLVRIAKDLGPYMRHFTSDVEAIVIYSYADKFGGDDHQNYCVNIKDKGEVSWYEEHQLELIKSNQIDLLEKWQCEHEQSISKYSDIDWIFQNGKKVIEKYHGATAKALGRILGIQNMYGPSGEGFVFMQNAQMIMSVSRPYLEKNDKAGFIDMAKNCTYPLLTPEAELKIAEKLIECFISERKSSCTQHQN